MKETLPPVCYKRPNPSFLSPQHIHLSYPLPPVSCRTILCRTFTRRLYSELLPRCIVQQLQYLIHEPQYQPLWWATFFWPLQDVYKFALYSALDPLERPYLIGKPSIMQVERSDWLTNHAFTDTRYGGHPQYLRQNSTPFQGTSNRHPRRPGPNQNPTPPQIIPLYPGQQPYAPQNSPHHRRESTNAPLRPTTPTYSGDKDAGCFSWLLCFRRSKSKRQ